MQVPRLRTAALTAALMTAAVPALPTSANAWGWGHGGWGWGGFGVGLAAGALIGGALAAPYYGGYYGYGIPYGYVIFRLTATAAMATAIPLTATAATAMPRPIPAVMATPVRTTAAGTMLMVADRIFAATWSTGHITTTRVSTRHHARGLSAG